MLRNSLPESLDVLCWFSFEWLAGWVTDDSLCWCACLLPGRRVGDCSWLRSTDLVCPKENERLEIIGYAIFWKDCFVQWWIPKEPRDTSYTTMLVLIGYNTYASFNKKEAVWVTFAFFMKNTSHLYLNRYVLAFFITSFYLTIFGAFLPHQRGWCNQEDIIIRMQCFVSSSCGITVVVVHTISKVKWFVVVSRIQIETNFVLLE